jgi:hypothetical protein
MFKNKETGLSHTALLPTFVGAVCFLLVKFGIVNPAILDGETVSAIVTVLGIGALIWRSYIKSGNKNGGQNGVGEGKNQ